MNNPEIKRCAIYTRKSVEEGLDMEFNSLDAQREAAEAYIASQRMNGWIALPKAYNDGGFTGANTNRPALKELLEDVKADKVDIIVVYKLDRLSRSLIDFAELQTLFDKHHVSFVSVTQQIDTSNSAGRMLLNILMTFAQFERETIAERVRDKYAASRKKGLWMGGSAPYGYKAVEKKLVVDESLRDTIVGIFTRFIETESTAQIAAELNDAHIKSANGKEWLPKGIYYLLKNVAYIGKLTYKGELYDAAHEPIIPYDLWDQVQAIIKKNGKETQQTNIKTLAPLKGFLRCGECDSPMIPVYAIKNKRRYCYYECLHDKNHARSTCPIKRISAETIEGMVYREVGKILQSETFASLVAEPSCINLDDYNRSISDLPQFWDDLFPVERNRLLSLLIESVVLMSDGMKLTFRTEGMKTLIQEITHENDECTA